MPVIEKNICCGVCVFFEDMNVGVTKKGDAAGIGNNRFGIGNSWPVTIITSCEAGVGS